MSRYFLFHESNPNGPLIKRLNGFANNFVFGDFGKIKDSALYTIAGKLINMYLNNINKNLKYLKPLVSVPRGLDLRKKLEVKNLVGSLKYFADNKMRIKVWKIMGLRIKNM